MSKFSKLFCSVVGYLIFIPLSLQAQELSVMTYNIRFDDKSESQRGWQQRKNKVISLLDYYASDIIGTQEGLKHQLDEISSALPDYSYVGVGRDHGDVRGEHTAIFYKHDKLECIQSATFWLSGTPEKPSKGWDAALNRICTYGLFKTKSSNQSFWLFNLHLDHVGSDARYNSIKLLMDQVKQINEQDYPVFVIGDLNVEPEDEPIKLLKKEYFDSYALSSLKPYGPKGTFNAFNFDKIVERRIDYIFVSKHINQINKYRVIDDSWNFNYPSDHLPVLIHCRL